MSNLATVDPSDLKYRSWFITELHKRFNPFPKQVEISRALENGYWPFAGFGRKGSKTSTASYNGVRKAGLSKEKNILIVAPKLKQVKEIYFDSRALDKMIPEDALADRYKSELRFVFHTGSFIRLDGADNPELHRGIDVDLLICDEIKDFPVEFWPAMEFNLISVGGQMLILGTPPDNDEEESAKKFLELQARFTSDPKCKYFTGTSYDNPYNDQQAIAALEKQHRDLGQDDVVMREIYGVYVPGGRQAIFPQFDNPKIGSKNVYEDINLEFEWRAQMQQNQLEFWCVADPGTAKCFAVAFIALNRETGLIYVIKSFGEKSQAQNSTGQIMERVFASCHELGPKIERWRFIYDEAGLWFYNECVAQKINPGWEATSKNLWKSATDDLKPGISTLRDIMRRGLIRVGEKRNEDMIRQIKAYAKDKKGNIPKKNDDLIDILRYFVMSSAYEPPPEAMSKEVPQTSALDNKLTMPISLDPEIHNEMYFENYLFEEYDAWEF